MSENTENRYWVGETTFPENGKMVYALSDGEPITGVIYAVHRGRFSFVRMRLQKREATWPAKVLV